MVQVDLITGFLGSGKTTFMRHYARYMVQQGWNVCILENDFGAVNVDVMLLQDTTTFMLGLIRLLLPKVLLPATTALGTIAATESNTITSMAPERTSASVISSACSPVSG